MLMRNIMNYAGRSFCRIYAAVGIKKIDFILEGADYYVVRKGWMPRTDGEML